MKKSELKAVIKSIIREADSYGYKVVKLPIEMSSDDNGDEDYYVTYQGKKYWVDDVGKVQPRDVGKKHNIELDLKKKTFQFT